RRSGCGAGAGARPGSCRPAPAGPRREGGCVSGGGGRGGSAPLASTEPVARSPIAPAAPVLVIAGWEVSGHRARAGLTLTDCTPLAKVAVRAPVGGRAAAELTVPFGRAATGPSGGLVAGSGPGEWLLLAAPGESPALIARAEGIAARCPGELVTATDVTHGRALMRLTGPPATPLPRHPSALP